MRNFMMALNKRGKLTDEKINPELHREAFLYSLGMK